MRDGVEERVIVDVKVTPIDKQQLLTYLRLRQVQLGLVINFHLERLVDGIHRVVDRLDE